MSGQLFIGVDGGASICRARIRDIQGNLLGEGVSGPANIHLDLLLAKESIRTAIAAATQAAGLKEWLSAHGHLGLGLAGTGASAWNNLRAELSQYASVELESDAYIAWLGAYQGGDGAIVILGTGSCGLAVVNGERTVVGGWGAEVSDEAGGQRMGREALRRTLWAYDGRAAKTQLALDILHRFQSNPARMVSFASTATPAAFAKLAPIVLEYAALRDPLAVALVEEAADAATRIINRLIDVGAKKICLIGGLAEPLTAWLPSRIRRLLTPAQSDPVDGAILLARQAFYKLESVGLKAG